jgi:hypothetical protein
VDRRAKVIDVQPALAQLPRDADGEEGKLHEAGDSVRYPAWVRRSRVINYKKLGKERQRTSPVRAGSVGGSGG